MKDNNNMKKTRHEGDESTVSFWLYMSGLYKEEINEERFIMKGKNKDGNII